MIIDMVAYGCWVAAICLGAFALVVYGFGDGDLGTNCNNNLEGCELVFRARGTTFACLSWFVLFLAWEMVDFRRSLFNMRPAPSNRKRAKATQWIRDIWHNPFLFWSIMIGFAGVFPLIYIPVINDKVFRHTGISWEWGIVFIGTGLFFAGAELWKWLKRAFFRRREKWRAKRRAGKEGDLEYNIS